MILNFTCPKCGHTILEETILNASVYGIVQVSDNYSILAKGRPEIEDGDLHSYGCAHCDFIIRYESGYNITAIEDLVEWLKEHQGESTSKP